MLLDGNRNMCGNLRLKVLINVELCVLLFTVLLSTTDASRILGIFPFQSRSHHMMFDAIAKGLIRRGHQFDIMTHFPMKRPVSNYTVVVNLEDTHQSFVDSWDFKFAAELDDTMSTALPTLYGNNICDHMNHPDFLKIMKNPPNNPPYDLVIMEALASPCYIGVGWALKVPVIMASSSRDITWLDDLLGQPTNTAYFPQFFTDYFHPMTFFERLHNTIKTHTDLYYFRRLSDDYQNNLVKKCINPNIPSLRDLEKDVVLSLVNSYHSIHGIRPMLPSLIEVAGVHVWEHYEPLPLELEKWMNDSTAGVIYFSLGSMIKSETIPNDIMRAFYSAFKKLAPIKVLMRVTNPNKLLPGLPSNVKIASWIPQVAVLGHKNTKAFFTHGGLMGTQEALTFGVPLVGLPLFADQFTNINAYVRKNMALKLNKNNLTEPSIYHAFKEVLENPKYMNAAKFESNRFLDRPMSALDTTIFWTEYAIKHGPGALRSPTVDMPWWQVALLDVYIFILLSIVFVIYLIFIILRLVLNIYNLYIKKSKIE